MNNPGKYIMTGAMTLIILGGTAMSMSRAQHNRLGMKLRGTAAQHGGIGNMTSKSVNNINKWMDFPSTQTGQYINRHTNSPISPNNHGSSRHNPVRVGKVVSGTGAVSPAGLNAARIHKVADISHNVRDVDGFKITPKLRQEAQRIVDHVNRTGRLPQNLPSWVDESRTLPSRGSSASQAINPTHKGLIRNTKSALNSAARTGATTARSLSAGVFSQAAGNALAGGAMVVFFDTAIAGAKYANGEISHGDLKNEIEHATIRGATVCAATGTLYMLVGSPHVAVVVGVAIGSYIAADYAIGVWEDHYGTKPLDLNDYRGILPDRIIDRPMMDDVMVGRASLR